MAQGCKVYIGNLPLDIKEHEIEDLFYKFGKWRYIDIKAPSRPPAFAFIEFEDPRAAAEAVRRRDGIEAFGQRIRCEVAKGGSGHARENFRPPRSSGFRVLVKGLPKMASWQDLKDHVRTICKPNYTDVRKDHNGNVVGVVEFDTYEDMKLAIQKLDDTEFKNPRYERGHYVRLYEDGPDAPRGGGRDDDRGRSRSRSPRRRSPSRSRSPAGADRERGRDDRPKGRYPEDDQPPPRARTPSRSPSRSRSRSR